jgi:hypothetical protein
MVKANLAPTPIVELGSDIFGNKNHMRESANELVFFGVGLGSHQRKDRGAIRRGNRHPAVTGFRAGIIDQNESQLVQVES